MSAELQKPLADLKVKQTQLFINNEYVNSESGQTFETINPATGKKIADIQEGDKADVDKAVKVARAAVKIGSEWRRMDASGRGRLLNKLADLMERDRLYLATLESLDVGKPFKDAFYGDIVGGMKNLRYHAGLADKITGQTIPIDGDFFCYTRMEPVGVVGQIVPWNFPLAIMCQKVAAALAAGCAIVVKPAEQTPLTAIAMGALFAEAGFPAGVVNIIPGFGPKAGAAIAEHMDINKVSFTGSTVTGRKIQQASGTSNLKRVTLELGGKSPNIILSDADLDTAVAQSTVAVMANMGQICCAGTRTYVQDSIYDEFVARSVELAKKRTVGDPLDPANDNGAQIDENQTKKILALIESGKQEGARLLTGGKRIGDTGCFLEPTVFADVTEDMRIGQEEIFGPVQSIFKFSTVEDAIEKANKTHYGLAASVFTKDIDKALTIANGIEAGTVWINHVLNVQASAPFGGFKMSGTGREMGWDGIREYLEVKTVMVKIPQKNS